MIDLGGHPSLVPIGGLFLAVVGVAIAVGALIPRFRRASVWIGLSLGAGAAVVVGSRTTLIPSPTVLQLASLGVAVAAEVGAFVTLMPRLYRLGPRAVAAGTLAIVGSHFVLMAPAFGPWIIALGVFCVLNAFILWSTPRYSINRAWFVDGMLKLLLGAAMIAAA